MSHTSNRKGPHERHSDTSPVMCIVDGRLGNGQHGEVYQRTTNRDTTNAPFSVPQALRIRLGRGISSQEQDISVDTLLSDLFSSQWEKRVTAVRTLEIFGRQAPVRVVRGLTGALLDESPYVRAAAAQALAKLEEHAPREDLMLLLDDPSWEVRASVIHALGKLGLEAPINNLIHALEDDDPAVRAMAVSALGKLKRPTLLRPLIKTLKDEDVFVRLAVVEALGEQEENIPTNTLMKQINDEDGNVRLAVLNALSNLGERVPIGILTIALEDKDETIRLRALQILKELGERVPLESLLITLKDQSEQVQREASKLLGKFSTEVLNRVSPTFLVHLLADESEHLRAIAAWMLGEQKAFTAKEPLLTALNDSSEIVRTAVNWTLRELGAYVEEKPASELSPYKNGLQAQVVINQTRALHERQTSATSFLSMLIEYLKDKSGYVQQESLDTPDERILILFCEYQNKGHSFQKMVLDGLVHGPFVEQLNTVLQSDDEPLRKITTKAFKQLQERGGKEAFLTSLELLQDTTMEKDKEVPTRIILCSVSFPDMRKSEIPILGQILTTFEQEAICDYSFKLRRSHQGEKPPGTQQQNNHMTTPVTWLSELNPSYLGGALKDIKIWYATPQTTLGNLGFPY